MNEASDAGFADVGRLLERLERSASDAERERSRELLSAVLKAHESALERLLSSLRDDAPELLTKLSDDPLIAPMLMLHGLHPRSLEERIEETVARLKPRLAAQRAELQLKGIDADGTVRLTLQHGGKSDALTAEIEEAFARSAADASDVVIEQTVEQPLRFDPRRGGAAA